jgi:hypothetical protein
MKKTNKLLQELKKEREQILAPREEHKELTAYVRRLRQVQRKHGEAYKLTPIPAKN